MVERKQDERQGLCGGVQRRMNRPRERKGKAAPGWARRHGVSEAACVVGQDRGIQGQATAITEDVNYPQLNSIIAIR